ncbi:MAG: E3 binding domain-containing protein, partial [Chitinophagales bacterium]|nr:E3 binding domain-containing protein [Chitinophagales bacterium]
MAKVEIKVPSVGESVTEVTLSSWLVEDGDYVKLDQSIAEFESDKATFEMPSEAAGIITRVANEGDDIKIGGLVAYIDTDAAAPEKPTEKIEEKKVEEKIEVITKQEENLKSEISNLQSNYATGTPSPAAKKILDEKGIDTSDVNGTGVDGRITKEDALKSIVNSQQSIEKKVEVAKETIDYRPSTADFSRSERVEKMTRMRKTISRRLVAVKNQTAMLTTFNEVDMTRIHEIRAQYKKSFEEQKGIGLGFMSFFTKA